MIGLYLSGTGNTEHCVKLLLSLLDPEARAVPIEQDDAAEWPAGHDFIVLGHSTQYSNCPKMMRDFIVGHADLWRGKRVLCLATMGLFSGDGAGCSGRLVARCGGTVVGGLQVRMPDSVCDSKALKKPLEENRGIVAAADRKIRETAADIEKGTFPREGLGPLHRLAGLFGQRLWFYGKTQRYSDKVAFSDACVGCGTCVRVCPMRNITMEDGRPVAHGNCTMCYRCISLCPERAITLLGDAVVEQCRYAKYAADGFR